MPAPSLKTGGSAEAAAAAAKAAKKNAAPAAAVKPASGGKAGEAAAKGGEPNNLAAVGAGVAVLGLALATLGNGGSSEAAAASSSSSSSPPSAAADAAVDPAKLRALFVALMGDARSRALMRDLLSGAGLTFDEGEFERQVADQAAFDASIAPLLRRLPKDKLDVLSRLVEQGGQAAAAGVAASAGDIAPLAKELSGDVKATIEAIKAKAE